MSASLLFSIVTFIYLLSALLYTVFLVFKMPKIGVCGTILSIAGLIIQTIALAMRWIHSYEMGIGHAPLSNLYESLVFFAWAIVLLNIIFEFRYKTRSIGVLPLTFAFLSMAYASFSSDINSQIQPLLPALQSNWLLTHVTTCFLGYASFAISACISIVYLILKNSSGQWKGNNFLPSFNVMDELIYRSVVFGFLLLTLGIITGSVWANQAWGSYWSWDPKETWSLITWFVYLILLHARYSRGWHGQKIAWLSVLGFGAVLFTYFGVNNLLPGLHSYA